MANSHGREASPLARWAQEFGRRLVHVVHVVDLDQQLVGHHGFEEPGDGFVQLRAPVRFRQFQDLGRGGNFDVEHGGEQRQPRREVGRLGRHLRADTLLDRRVGRVAAEFVHLAQQLAPHDIRDRRRVGLAGGVELLESRDRVAQRFEQPGLADPGVSDDLDQAARARRARS